MSEERRYEVLSVLGQGGFGTVYHARFLGEGGFTKEVALKVLNPDMEGVAEIASRLRDEARVLGLIRHRAIVGVDRLTQLDGRWTVVMEYIEGQDVGHLLSTGPVPVGAALEITAEVAGALHAAYTRIGPGGQPLRLLHRDLKPSNIRVTPFGEVKVLDFGIARAEFGGREAKTRSLAFGTPEYMSPERLDFSGDAAPGDVYALGAVLYELLTGDQLGRSSAHPGKHTRKLESAEAALLAEQVPQPARELVLKMISYEEQARPAAADVERRANALARSVGGASLREWVEGLGDALVASAPAPNPTTGSILVERPEPSVEIAANTVAADPVIADPAQTVWQRAPVPPPSGPRSPSPVRLTPAETTVTPAGPPIVRPDAAPAPPRLAPPRAPGSLAGVAVGLTLLALVGLVAGAGLWWSRSTPPASTLPAEDPTGPAVLASSVTTETEPAASPPVTAAPAIAVATAPTPAVTTTAAPPPTTARATPSVVDVGRTGDAIRVSLVSKARTVSLPGKAPAGSYKIFASFEGEPEAAVGTVEVKAGQPITVHCDSQFGKCSAARGAR